MAPRKRTSGRRRSKGTGSTYWVPARKRWAGAFVEVGEDGTKRRRVVYGLTEEEARERLDDVRRQARLAPTRTIARDSVATYLTGWLARHRGQVRPATWLVRKGHIENHIIPTVGTRTLPRLTPQDVERMTGEMVTKGLSPRTAAHVRTTLRLALRDAQRDGLISQNPAALARPPRVAHVEMAVLDAGQIKHLLASTEGDRWQGVWALLAGTGLRLGEAMGLTWDDLDLDGGTVTVRRAWARTGPRSWGVSEPKTPRSRRVVPMPSWVVSALRGTFAIQEEERLAVGDHVWQTHPEGQPVITDTVGRRPDPTAVGRVLTPALAAAGLPSVRLHDLRHSYATTLLQQGIPLVTVSRLLGHSGIVVTANTYAHISTSLKRDAADALERAFDDA